MLYKAQTDLQETHIRYINLVLATFKLIQIQNNPVEASEVLHEWK